MNYVVQLTVTDVYSYIYICEHEGHVLMFLHLTHTKCSFKFICAFYTLDIYSFGEIFTLHWPNMLTLTLSFKIKCKKFL